MSPAKLPIAGAVAAAAHTYFSFVDLLSPAQWTRVTYTLETGMNVNNMSAGSQPEPKNYLQAFLHWVTKLIGTLAEVSCTPGTFSVDLMSHPPRQGKYSLVQIASTRDSRRKCAPPQTAPKLL